MKVQAPKTPKLFVGGQFVRSESGRTYKHQDSNVPLASRKDARDAVVAAQKAQTSWANATAYNKGQIIYRLAEMMSDHVFSQTSNQEKELGTEITVHFAGWSDKFGALLSSVNPVAGQIHNFTRPEPTGVVACICAQEFGFANALLSALPPIVAGNTVVLVAHEQSPLPVLELAEAFATSDLPAGVVNILSGIESEVFPHLAEHVSVDGLDVSGSSCPDVWHEHASQTIKRVRRWAPLRSREDWHKIDTLERVEAFVEQKTVWHSVSW